jgi:hypothetical protein
MVELNDEVGLASVNEDDPRYSAMKKRYFIRDGRRDFLVNTNGVPNRFSFEGDVVNRVPDVHGDLDFARNAALVNWMHRSKIDPSAPAQQTARLGAYMLPNCASFKVEWAFDVSDVDLSAFAEHPDIALRLDRILGTDVIWIDPYSLGKAIERIQSVVRQDDEYGVKINLQKLVVLLRDRLFPHDLTDPANALPGAPGTIRFLPSVPVTGMTETALSRTHIFYSTDPDAPSDMAVPDPLFPMALRITVDLYDTANRLERPVRHVMVLPVGGG